MISTVNDNIQPGSLRIRLSDDGQTLELVRFNGAGWDIAQNNGDPALQHDMRNAVPGPQRDLLYVPTPRVGMNARFSPPKAA
jgi:hypothetical protein